MRVVLASNNAKKLKELGALLAPAGVELVTQGSLGIAEAEEPHHTFIENALAKARHAARASGLPALADDSGLCVDALGGAPGVYSAHYATLPEAVADGLDREDLRARQDAANNAKLLRALADRIEPAARSARFVCTLVAVRSADDPEPLVAFGRWPGQILPAARGAGGFGYDPLMWIPALGASAAELATDVKNAHSHRARAAAEMLRQLDAAWAHLLHPRA
ncbi:RdgB/HAM1 family non-canonical purine NTP pyrophosphatase [Leptothrix discophora]|uniref:dITP/XTP pyrophosphatase n=1 Tax=Leptothrix discophora TaxID=89 RepID=A0ABT9G374_LEPDI|nr:RdgB/HAM1 family non-canonical purine NTP pyrophosphatase [Leptothrix discophora]MDP4300925.1 RdgB/HAM1 family non-canonical purine NTP pyrophosphatase [Leptothrix discophora]